MLPEAALAEYVNGLGAVFGERACTVLAVRQPGAIEVNL
jgi:hypothetical protein